MKVLFISHDSSTTGAPKSLTQFLNWLEVNHPEVKFDVLLNRGKELTNLNKSVFTYVFRPEKLERSAQLANRVTHHLGLLNTLRKNYRKELKKKIWEAQYDVIYSNTVVNGEILELLSDIPCKKIVHVRELQSSIDHFGGERLLELNDKNAQKFIAITKAVKDNLTQKGIKADKIKVIRNHAVIRSIDQGIKRKLREEMGLPQDAYVVGGCGSFIWRKGFDLFLSLAAMYRDDTKVYFVWYGKIKKNQLFEINYDLERTGLKDRFIIHSFPSEKSLEYFSVFDIYLLTSREEPFGLTGLEAALNEVPVLCFKDAGGQPEFVSLGAGFVIPYLNLLKMKQKIDELRLNTMLAEKIGKKGKSLVHQFYDIEKIAPELLNIMYND